MAHWFLSVTHGTARFSYSFLRLSRELGPLPEQEIVQAPIPDTYYRVRGGTMSNSVEPIHRRIHDVDGHLDVVRAASEQGYIETALEACLSAKEKVQAIREELMRPEPGIADRRQDYDS